MRRACEERREQPARAGAARSSAPAPAAREVCNPLAPGAHTRLARRAPAARNMLRTRTAGGLRVRCAARTGSKRKRAGTGPAATCSPAPRPVQGSKRLGRSVTKASGRCPLRRPAEHAFCAKARAMVNTTTPAASKLACDIIRDHLGALAEVRSERRGQRTRKARLTCVVRTARGSLAGVRRTTDAG
jgi:hypothetical protein